MYLDVAHLKEFYDLPLGRKLRVLVGSKIRYLWPEMRNRSLLGLGYAAPFLRLYLKETSQIFAGMPAAQGVVKWPREAQVTNKAFLMYPDQLPFPDSSIDRIMLVHAVDMVDDPSSLLEEVYRVLAPGGRILMVIPNRRGAWARSEVSPFGYGRPYSRRQAESLLNRHMLNVVGSEEALFLPPSHSNLVLQSARTFEWLGPMLWPAFAGLLVIEAEKQVYRGLTARKSRFDRVMRPVFLPNGKTAGAQVKESSEGAISTPSC